MTPLGTTARERIVSRGLVRRPARVERTSAIARSSRRAGGVCTSGQPEVRPVDALAALPRGGRDRRRRSRVAARTRWAGSTCSPRTCSSTCWISQPRHRARARRRAGPALALLPPRATSWAPLAPGSGSRGSLSFLLQPACRRLMWIGVLVRGGTSQPCRRGTRQPARPSTRDTSALTRGALRLGAHRRSERSGRLTLNGRIGLAVLLFWIGQLLAYAFVFRSRVLRRLRGTAGAVARADAARRPEGRGRGDDGRAGADAGGGDRRARAAARRSRGVAAPTPEPVSCPRHGRSRSSAVPALAAVAVALYTRAWRRAAGPGGARRASGSAWPSWSERSTRPSGQSRSTTSSSSTCSRT